MPLPRGPATAKTAATEVQSPSFLSVFAAGWHSHEPHPDGVSLGIACRSVLLRVDAPATRSLMPLFLSIGLNCVRSSRNSAKIRACMMRGTCVHSCCARVGIREGHLQER